MCVKLSTVMKKIIITTADKDTILKLHTAKKGSVKYVATRFAVSRHVASSIIKLIIGSKITEQEILEIEVDDRNQAIPIDNSIDNTHVEFIGKYTYNPVTDQYVVPLKSTGKTAVVDGWKHRGMLQAYTGLSGKKVSINEMCIKYGFTRAAFDEYRRIMGWTHDAIPFTDEQVENQSEESIINDLKQAKKFALHTKFTRGEWEETQQDAIKWRQFQAKQLDPFEQALKNYQPTPLPSIEYTGCGKNENKTLLIGLSDLHFGALAVKDQLLKGKDYNVGLAQIAVDKYLTDILVRTNGRDISNCVVAVLGDILHSLSGKTKKGTELEFDVIREEQFDAAMDSLIWFLTGLTNRFNSVEVQMVHGNHAGFDEYILFRAIEQHFTNNHRISFSLSKNRTKLFRVGATLVVMDHGDSDYVKAPVPSGKAQEPWIQALLLANPALLVGAKHKIFLCGDKHHFENVEYNDFEYFMFGTTVQGDRYADAINKRSRPRQACLILGDTGVEEVIHFYFD